MKNQMWMLLVFPAAWIILIFVPIAFGRWQHSVVAGILCFLGSMLLVGAVVTVCILLGKVK